MARRLKPENELSEHQKKQRKYFEKNPEAHQKMKQYQKEYHIKNRESLRIKKRQKGKIRIAEVIKILGSECASCGEKHNPNLRRSNLEIDHKFYLRGEFAGTSTGYRILRLKKQGVNPKEQYNLLCHSCHVIVTYIRKNPSKANDVINFLKSADIMKEQ